MLEGVVLLWLTGTAGAWVEDTMVLTEVGTNDSMFLLLPCLLARRFLEGAIRRRC